MVYSSNPTWLDHYPPTPPPQSFPIRFNFQMGVLPRNDFVANASVSPDYTPFDATFQDRTTFIHHGAYHVAWMLLWECDIVQFSGVVLVVKKWFLTCTKRGSDQHHSGFCLGYISVLNAMCTYIYICPCVYISLNKYPSCKGSLFGAEIVALGFFWQNFDLGSRFWQVWIFDSSWCRGHSTITSPTMASLAGPRENWLHPMMTWLTNGHKMAVWVEN